MRYRSAVIPLAIVALLALAGCAEPAGSLRMTEVDDSELADRTSRPTSGGEDFPAIRQQVVVSAAIENGSVTVADLRPLVHTDLPYRHQNRYYDVRRASQTAVQGVELTIAVDANASEPTGPGIAFRDLDRADQRRLRPFLEHDARELVQGTDYRFPVALRADAESKILQHAGSSVVVAYDGSEYVLEIGSPEETTVHLQTYTATLRAESTEAYASSLRRNYTVDLSDAEGAERSVLESAAGDSYYAEDTDDQAFANVIDRLRREPAIRREDASGTWLVRFDGAVYLTEANFHQFLADDTPESETPPVTPN